MDDALFLSQPSLVTEGFSLLMSLFLSKDLCQMANSLCKSSEKHSPVVQGSGDGGDHVEDPDASQYVQFREEKDTDRITRRRSWDAVVIGHTCQTLVEIVTNSIGPEPDPIDTDRGDEAKATMRSEPSIVTDRFRAFVAVVSSPVTPQAEDAEQIASTELHEDKAIDVSQLVRTTNGSPFDD